MFENNSYDLILDRMLSRVPDKFDKREGSVIFDTHSPTALELQFLYIELERIMKEAYGSTASREFLILRCRERGITPYEATNAVLKGVFMPISVDVTGKRFNIGSVNYTVLERISGSEYKVQCETLGITGNQQLGNLIPIDYIDGLETAELVEVLIPGADEANTEELRKRYF
ncbi:MAG: baseplate J/gp47 family protein, partial [Ruminiclostridium sp.]|nr:baseplate J/gp47 family protein [Ruminiclostridium sp.]